MTWIGTFAVGAAALALSLIGPVHAAAAQRPATRPACLSESELRAMMTFALPSALDGLIVHCTPHLPGNAFLRRSGAGLVASYRSGRMSAWPLAKTAFIKLAGDKEPESVQVVAKMPDSALQPFVEGIIGGMIGAKLKPGQCALADTMIRLLAPLPPGNTAELLTAIVVLGASEPKKGQPAPLAVCPA